MLRTSSMMVGLALAFGASACGSDRDVVSAPVGAIPAPSPGEAGAPDDALPPDEEPSSSTPDGTDGGVASSVDPGALGPVPPRELDIPEWAAEDVARTCIDDGPLCYGGQCPTFGEVLDDARSKSRSWALRDYCQADDGEPFITLAMFELPGSIHVFRAGSGELVSRVFIDDVPACEGPVTSNRRVTGRFIPDCMWVREAEVPCSETTAAGLGEFVSCYYDLLP